MKIAITGSSGFVAKNLINYFSLKHTIFKINRDELVNGSLSVIFSDNDIIIHSAGKAHDLKLTSNSSEYYLVNTELTKNTFDTFLNSSAKAFIFISSVKAVADKLEDILTEDYKPLPITHYGKSKLFAEQYILSKPIPIGKRIYILRPCMIHGIGNKGNLNFLYKFVSMGIPWPLGAFKNKRSFCSIDNLSFIINELIENEAIPSGIYNIADDEPIGTNKLIEIISISLNKTPHIWRVPHFIINNIAKVGDILRLPLNTELLRKLTESYTVSNKKILSVLGKELTIYSKDGLKKTFQSFNH